MLLTVAILSVAPLRTFMPLSRNVRPGRLAPGRVIMADGESLDDRLAALEESLRSLQAEQASPEATRLAAMEEALQDLKKSVAGREAQPQPVANEEPSMGSAEAFASAYAEAFASVPDNAPTEPTDAAGSPGATPTEFERIPAPWRLGVSGQRCAVVL